MTFEKNLSHNRAVSPLKGWDITRSSVAGCAKLGSLNEQRPAPRAYAKPELGSENWPAEVESVRKALPLVRT
ncbi:hypothetical protein Y030_2135 [Burkholderia pseudomallei MSHR332]|nr:hypothetical protein Y030_2135 [Burkholderia pseudomallei MSHR332]